MFKNREGQQVPDVEVNSIVAGQWKKINTSTLFKNQNVIVFSLPGAFTPTCSSSHLPRYNELAPVFAKNAIDRIICVSVNDTFVMNAWAEAQNVSNIEFLPDGNGDFTREMGMLVDKNDLGFGQRSWRYAMLVRDGKIEKMFIEADLPGDPFDVSDADTLLDYLNPEAQKPSSISMITKANCGHCSRAKAALEQRGLSFEEIELGKNGLTNISLQALSGKASTPQIFVDGELIGGADELEQWLDR